MRETEVSAKRVTPAPKLSKDDLRAQVAKLERANRNLRAKNKELRRAADEAAERIAHLERAIGQHEWRAAKNVAPAGGGRSPGHRAASTQPRSGRDPGDAVPPGVAIEEPERLSEEQSPEPEETTDAIP